MRIFSEEGLGINKQVVPVPEFQREERTKHSLKVGEPKTSCSNRVIPLNEDVIHELAIHKAWQQEDMMKNGYRTDFLFTIDTGELYDKRNVSRACSRYYARIGIENKSSTHTAILSVQTFVKRSFYTDRISIVGS